jgi:hypothetical protein
MAFEGGPPTKHLDIPPPTRLRWGRDGRSLLYTKTESGVTNIWSQPITGGMPKQITHFTSETIQRFDLSQDGKQLVMNRGTINEDVVLIRDLR